MIGHSQMLYMQCYPRNIAKCGSFPVKMTCACKQGSNEPTSCARMREALAKIEESIRRAQEIKHGSKDHIRLLSGNPPCQGGSVLHETSTIPDHSTEQTPANTGNDHN
jgi:hypothetical protein